MKNVHGHREAEASVLKNYRKSLGLKQQEIADQLRVSKSIWVKWENALAPVPKWVEPAVRRMFNSFQLENLAPEEIALLNQRAQAAGKSVERYIMDIIKATLPTIALSLATVCLF